MTATAMDELNEARAAWDAACNRAEKALAALRPLGHPIAGPELEEWNAACAESRRTSDIWYRIWARSGRPVCAAGGTGNLRRVTDLTKDDTRE